MSTLAPTLEAFFIERLLNQRCASLRTVSAYRDTLRMLLVFAQDRIGKAPFELEISDISADLVSAFLTHLEKERHNSARTRNARLAAIRSLFRYAALRHPEHAASIQRVLAIPSKRFIRKEVCFLTRDEESALIQAPDQTTWFGRRDHVLLLLAVRTGLRVSEITGLTCGDITFGPGAQVRCVGKGRKERITPLTSDTSAVLAVWMKERAGEPTDPLFSTIRGSRLSSDAIQRLVAKHVTGAINDCSSIANKRITPHSLRHTCAMNLLQSGVDTSVIALWLGHEQIQTTQIYLHADILLKEKALAQTTPHPTKSGRYKAPDQLLAFLENL